MSDLGHPRGPAHRRMKPSTVLAVAVAVLAAACVDVAVPTSEVGLSSTSTVGVTSTLGSGSSTTAFSDPTDAETAVAILDIAQAGRGRFTEGSFSFIEVTGSDGDLISKGAFGPAQHIVLQERVSAGQVGIRAYQRGCSGFCPPGGNMDALDPISIECETTIDVSSGELVRVLVDGRSCEITRIDIPETTPRRCLPDEVALLTDPQPPSDGLVVVTVGIKNVGPELCEVVLDDVRAALTDGAGHLIPASFAEGNPLFFSGGAGAIFPGETLRVVFEWRHTCGEPIPTFQIDIENIGTSQAKVPYPCDIGEQGTFEFRGTYIRGQKAQGECSGVSVFRIDFPYLTAFEALSGALDKLVPSLEHPRMAALLDLTAADFVPALRDNTEVTFRTFNEVQEWRLYARRMGGGWGVDRVTACDYQ